MLRPRPQFVGRLAIYVSAHFPEYDERKDIGWPKFFKGSEPDMATSPLDLACKAFIDMMLSPEVDPERNTYPKKISDCVLAYLSEQYGWHASKDEVADLAACWARHRYGAEAGTASIRGWFNRVYGKRPWLKA